MSYLGGCVTNGSYFTYKGVRYGKYTQILFKDNVYERLNDVPKYLSVRTWGSKSPYFRTFRDIQQVNGKNVWLLGYPLATQRYVDIDPDRDIEQIIIPIYYYEPKELVKKRLMDGTWIWYIWPQTLFYIVCLLVSPVFQQWYIIWTTGLYLYLRIAYIKLSRGELYS